MQRGEIHNELKDKRLNATCFLESESLGVESAHDVPEKIMESNCPKIEKIRQKV